MGLTGGFPIDIILFGMIAAFLVLRLRGILGRRTGYEQPAQPAGPRDMTAPPAQKQAAAPPVPGARKTLPDPSGALGQTLSRMTALDLSFEPAGFLDGAEKAFQIIVRAFAAGERGQLRPLLGEDTWHAFEAAIAEREKSAHTQISDIRAMHALSIEQAELKGTLASVTVRIVSDQVNMTHGPSGQVLMGTDAVTEITDLWTFERDLKQADPVWHLVAARSA